MLTVEDCVGLCDLSEEEVLAIANHEHIPEVAAAELGDYLVHTPDGELSIRGMIREDIACHRQRPPRPRAGAEAGAAQFHRGPSALR